MRRCSSVAGRAASSPRPREDAHARRTATRRRRSGAGEPTTSNTYYLNNASNGSGARPYNRPWRSRSISTAKTIALSPGTLLGGVARRAGFDRGEGFERLWIGQAVHRRVLGENLANRPRLRGREVDSAHLRRGRLHRRARRAPRRPLRGGRPRGRGRGQVPAFRRGPRKAPGFRAPRALPAPAPLVHAGSGRRRRAARSRPTRPRGHRDGRDEASRRATRAREDRSRTSCAARGCSSTRSSRSGPSPRRKPPRPRRSSSRTSASGPASARWLPRSRAPPRRASISSSRPRPASGRLPPPCIPLLVGALESHRRLFVLTAKTTQQEIYEKTLGRHRRRVLSIRAAPRERAHVRERRRAVPREPLPVREGLRRQDGGLGPPRPAPRERTATSTRTRSSRRRATRPSARSRSPSSSPSRPTSSSATTTTSSTRSSRSPAARDPSALSDSILLVDEAHNLVDRGRGYYSPELSDAALATLEQRIGVSNAKTAWDAGEAARRLRKLVADAAAGPPEDEPEPVDLVTLDEARLDDLRLDFESLLVRHLADLRAGGERVPDDPVLDLYFSFARFHDVSKLVPPPGPCHVRGGLRRPRGARQGRRAARDPLQGPVEAPRRDAERGGGDRLDVRDAFPARVLPRSPRTRPRPHVGAPPSLALSAGEPLRVRRAGRGHDVRGARARRPAPRGPRRGRGARVPGQHARAVSVVPLSRRGARPPARADRRAASSGRPIARPSWSGTRCSRR